MVRTKVTLGALIVCASMPLAGGAQTVTTGTSNGGSADSRLPIEIQADHLYYGGNDGDVKAEGKVDLTQGTMALTADSVVGNTKTGMYAIPDGFTFKDSQPVATDIKGQNLRMKQQPLQVNAQSVEGYVEPLYLRAKDLSYNKDEADAKQAWVTTKHAMAWKNPPDYRVEGSEVKLDFKTHKVYVKNASFYIRNYKLFTLPSYRGHFGSSSKRNPSMFSFVPIPSYTVDEGIGLTGKVDYPIGDKDDLYFHYKYLTKAGFKPAVGLRHYESWGDVDFGFSRVPNRVFGETVWIEKRPELSLHTNELAIGDSPYTVWARASAGNWREGSVRGSHYLLHVEFARKTMHYGKWAVRPYAGFQKDWYAYNSKQRRMPYWGVDTSYRANDRLSFNLNYRHASIDGTVSPYRFDTVEIPLRIYAAVFYQATRLDKFIVSGDYNIENNRWEYVDYTWQRNMHSLEGYFTYHQRQHSFEYRIKALDF